MTLPTNATPDAAKRMAKAPNHGGKHDGRDQARFPLLPVLQSAHHESKAAPELVATISPRR